jgi:hypothetical protein
MPGGIRHLADLGIEMADLDRYTVYTGRFRVPILGEQNHEDQYTTRILRRVL